MTGATSSMTARGRRLAVGVGISLAWTCIGVILPLLALTAGTGLLYLLHVRGWLAVGPGIPDALSLEQLAGHASQPAVRMAFAWAGAGAAAGACLVTLRPRHFAAALTVFAIGGAVALVIAGAASDALTQNQPLARHVLPQLASAAPAFAWGAEVCAAALAGRAALARGAARRANRR